MKELLQDQEFIKDMVNLMSSRFLKMKKNHIMLLIDIYRATESRTDSKIILITWFIKMIKINNFVRLLCLAEKELIYPFLKEFVNESVLYRPPERAYRLLKVIEMMRKHSEVDSDFNNLAARAFSNYVSRGAFDEVICNYFLQDLNMLLQKKLITVDLAKQMELVARKNPKNLIKRMQLLFFLDGAGKRDGSLWDLLKEDI